MRAGIARQEPASRVACLGLLHGLLSLPRVSCLGVLSLPRGAGMLDVGLERGEADEEGLLRPDGA